MDHEINITHDGILKISIPKGFRINQVQVQERGTEKLQIFVPVIQEWQKLLFANYLAQNPKWIPVSERLPKEGTEVLGTDSYGCIRHVVKDKCGLYEFGTYEEMMHIEIVAWLPLPEPYKEDNNAD